MVAYYGVCYKTLNKWLKNEGLFLPRGLITPFHQEKVYEKLGRPKTSEGG